MMPFPASIAKQTGKSKEIQKNLIKIDTKGIVSEYGLMLPHRSGMSEKLSVRFNQFSQLELGLEIGTLEF